LEAAKSEEKRKHTRKGSGKNRLSKKERRGQQNTFEASASICFTLGTTGDELIHGGETEHRSLREEHGKRGWRGNSKTDGTSATKKFGGGGVGKGEKKKTCQRP